MVVICRLFVDIDRYVKILLPFNVFLLIFAHLSAMRVSPSVCVCVHSSSECEEGGPPLEVWNQPTIVTVKYSPKHTLKYTLNCTLTGVWASSLHPLVFVGVSPCPSARPLAKASWCSAMDYWYSI